MAFFNNVIAGASGQTAGDTGYAVEKSLRLNSGDTSYLAKTFASSGNRRTNTISFWVKRPKSDSGANFYRIFGSQQASHLYFYEDKIFWDVSTSSNSSAAGYRWTNRLFRDPTAWYHIVAALDTTQGTPANRMRLYVNGVEETSFQSAPNVNQNDQTGFSEGGIEHTFGYRSANQGSTGGALDAYLAEVHFVDGQALAPDDFGEFDATTGSWIPKEFTGSHGQNGFYLDFKTWTAGLDYISSATVADPNPSKFSGPFSNMFDGNLSTRVSVSGISVSDTNSMTLILSQTVSGNTRGYLRTETLYGTPRFKLYNGNTEVYNSVVNTGNSPGWHTFGNLTWNKLVYEIQRTSGAGSGSDIYGFEVGGNLLVSYAATAQDASDSNNDFGAYNVVTSATPNIDVTGFTATSGPGSGPNAAREPFDGSTDTNHLYAHGFGTHHVTINTSSTPIPISSSDELTIYWSTSTTNPRDCNLTLTFSGGATTTYSTFTRTSGLQNNTVTVGTTGSITQIKLQETSSSSPGEVHIKGIAKNGVLYNYNPDCDLVLDSPTNVQAGSGFNSGNYATFNPVQKHGGITLTNGNLFLQGTGNSWKSTQATIGMTSGKFYCEFGPYLYKDNNNHCQPGIMAVNIGNSSEMGGQNFSAFYHYSGTKFFNGQGGAGTSFGSAWNSNKKHVVGIAFDADTRKVWFSLDGVWQGSGDPANGTNEAGILNASDHPYAFTLGIHGTVDAPVRANFGAAGSYLYTPPTGFKSVCTENLQGESSVPDGNKQFKAVKRNGFGTSGGTVTTGFKPGLLWEKTRSGSGNHYLYDALRGVGKILFPNTANNETNDTNLDQVSGFTNTGYTLGGNEWSTSTTLVGWAWKEGENVNNFASNTHNQSKLWSNGVAGSNQVPNVQGFDGSLSTWAAPNGNSTLTWTPPATVTVSSSMRVYAAREASGDTITVNFTDGTSFNSFTADNVFRWYTVSSPAGKTISTIVWTHTTSKSKISAIEVDGKILVDAGLIPVGSLNSSAYSQDDVYSDDIATTGSVQSGTAATNAFDGNLLTQFGTQTGGGYTNPITFTPSGGLNYTTSVRVICPIGQMAARINGGSWVSFSTDATLATGSGTITTIEVTERRSNAGFGLYAIEVDGKILVDSNQTPPNVPLLATSCHLNDKAGMSIVTYKANLTVNDTIAHQLGEKPHFAIFKNRDNTAGNNQVDWGVYHHDLGARQIMELNQYFGQQTMGGPFNNVEPDAVKFTLGTGGHSYLTNGPAGDDFMGYIFREVPGFSKFSVYTGSGGQKFIDCGFTPAWVMIKRYTDNTVGEWSIYDNVRDGRNEIQKKLWANNSSGEEDHPNNSIDFVSNGFVIDPGSNSPNVQYTNNGNVGYLYAAFASSPFKTARAF